jgi:citrate synthase
LSVTINAGLEGIVVAETDLSLVDGKNGYLVYRGNWAKDLAISRTYEDVVHLLWRGHLPDERESEAFRAELAARRKLPDYLKTIIRALPPETDTMSVLRTATSAIGDRSFAWPPTFEQASEILAKAPTIIAYRNALNTGRDPIEPDESLGHAENYLYMLHGEKPTRVHTRALDAYIILTAEHGLNASTFTGRVITSTRSDIASAITGAIGALKGPLHGGAPSEVDTMLEEIGTKENAEPWLRQQIEAGERLMGFGHRVYKTMDPRAVALRQVADSFAGEDPWFDLSVHVEETAVRLLSEYKPGRNLYPNVEFWAAAVLRGVRIPTDLYTPTFGLARMAGWSAHILEQADKNRLIRPESTYVGEMPKAS